MPTHWSLDDLAYHLLKDAHYRDMSRSTVQRILAEADLKPPKSRYWLHSDDPAFEAKALAIGRLYLAAPRLYQQGELVVCVDEKTGIQALQRLHPTRPARPGQVALQEFEYLRHGTRCLLASLIVPTGQVLGSVTQARQEGEEGWRGRPKLRMGAQRRAFLQDPSHKHVVYYTPKHGSWLNQIEIWFGVLARRVLRRGEFRSVEELAQRILEYIAHYNRHQAHPYAWTYAGKPLASGDKAKRKRRRYQRTRLMDIGSR